MQLYSFLVWRSIVAMHLSPKLVTEGPQWRSVSLYVLLCSFLFGCPRRLLMIKVLGLQLVALHAAAIYLYIHIHMYSFFQRYIHI